MIAFKARTSQYCVPCLVTGLNNAQWCQWCCIQVVVHTPVPWAVGAPGGGRRGGGLPPSPGLTDRQSPPVTGGNQLKACSSQSGVYSPHTSTHPPTQHSGPQRAEITRHLTHYPHHTHTYMYASVTTPPHCVLYTPCAQLPHGVQAAGEGSL